MAAALPAIAAAKPAPGRITAAHAQHPITSMLSPATVIAHPEILQIH